MAENGGSSFSEIKALRIRVYIAALSSVECDCSRKAEQSLIILGMGCDSDDQRRASEDRDNDRKGHVGGR